MFSFRPGSENGSHHLGAPGCASADSKHQREQPFEELTHRESEVLKYIAEGNSTKQIAVMLGMAFKTVTCHRYRLMDKLLGIHDTESLVRDAIRNEITEA
jgi:DNA-binding NarL/FixJ family response regulator